MTPRKKPFPGPMSGCHLLCLWFTAVFGVPAFGAATDVDYVAAGIKAPLAPRLLYRSADNSLNLNAGLVVYGFGAVTHDINFGSRSSIDAAAPTGQSPDWWEAAAKPALGLEMALGPGTAFAAVEGSYALTRGSRYGDAAGATPGHPDHARLDRAYLGWRSGDLFTALLDENALSFSVGRQKFIFGDGFLVGDGYTDIGRNAAYYIGPSESFRNSAVASLDSHGWHLDLFHLQQNQHVMDANDETTRVHGINLDSTWAARAQFGAAYLRVYDSDVAHRNGMDVYNLRAKGVPLANVPDLSLGGQLVHENNSAGGIAANGWYLQATYTFSEAHWQPQLLYRRAEFGAGYDPLFYDFVGDWGNWYMGEIVGEYMLFNSNLDIDMVKASVRPRGDLEAGAIAYRFRHHDTEAVAADDRDFAKELNLYVDWAVSDRLTLLAVYATAFPDRGAASRFRDNNDIARLFELFVSYSF